MKREWTIEEREKLITRPAFQIYKDCEELIGELSDEQAGKIFREIFRYANLDQEAGNKLDQLERLVFKSFVRAMDSDMGKYIERCNKNKKNIETRWNKCEVTETESKKSSEKYDRIRNDTTVYDRIRNDTKNTDTETETETETDTDTDTDTDTGRGAGGTYTFFKPSADNQKQTDEQLRRYFINWQFKHMEQLNAEHITITLDDFMEQCRIVGFDGNIELTALKALQRLTG